MKFASVMVLGLLVSLNSFAQSKDAAIGTSVETVEAPAAPRILKGSFGFGFSNANSVEFNDANAVSKSGRQFPGSAELGIKPSYAIEVGLQHVPVRGLGYSAFIDYESKISVEKYNETYASQNFHGDFTTKPQLSLLTVSGNAVYGLDRMYIPFGVNVTLPEYQTNAQSSASASAGMGFQLGVGMYALENLAIDLTFKRRSFSLNEQFGSGGGRVLGNGSIDGLHLQARVLF